MAKRMSFVTEFVLFLRENKAYWLTPIVLALILLGVLMIVGSTSAAPFLYTLF